MKQNTKMMIKAKTANKIHSIIDPNPQKSKYFWQRRADDRLVEINKMTDAQKLEMFNQIIEADRKGSIELCNYAYEHRSKKRVQKRREASIAAGTRKRKNKTTKAQYEAMLVQAA